MTATRARVFQAQRLTPRFPCILCTAALEDQLKRLGQELINSHPLGENMVWTVFFCPQFFSPSSLFEFTRLSNSTSSQTSKANIHLRLAPLGPGHGILRRVPRADHIGTMIEFAGGLLLLLTSSLSLTSNSGALPLNSLSSGTVIRVGTVKMLEYEKQYRCMTCQHVFSIEVRPDDEREFDNTSQSPTSLLRLSFAPAGGL